MLSTPTVDISAPPGGLGAAAYLHGLRVNGSACICKRTAVHTGHQWSQERRPDIDLDLLSWLMCN